MFYAMKESSKAREEEYARIMSVPEKPEISSCFDSEEESNNKPQRGNSGQSKTEHNKSE
jgi:hypothetical protein